MQDPGAAWPLAERDVELAQIAGLLAHGRHVLVRGPAGIGKTRLVNTASAAAAMAGDGASVFKVGTSSASAAIPLLAVAHLAGPAAPPTEPVALFAAVRAHLESHGRAIVVVDDGHWLDEPSAALLGQLAMAGAIVLVVTARDGEVLPEPVERVSQGDAGGRIDLGPLSRDGVESLLSTVLGAPIEPSSAIRLHRVSAGVPLVLQELVGAARATGDLSLVGTAWRLHGAPAPSPALVDLVAARLRHAPVEAVKVLELIAVSGTLGGASVEGLESPAALAAAEAAGLVAVGADRRRRSVRPAHPVYGEAVLARMAGSRRADLAARLAEHVESRGRRRRRDVVQVALWRLDAGLGVGVDVLLAALGEVAGLDPAVAARVATAAVLEGAGPTAVAHEARALVGQGKVTEAVERLRTALDLALALPDVPEGEEPAAGETVAPSTSTAREFAGTYLSYILAVHFGRVDEALAILDRVEPRLATDDTWHVREIRVLVAERSAHVDHASVVRDSLLTEVPKERRDRTVVTTSSVLASMVAAGRVQPALEGSLEAIEALERVSEVASIGASPWRMHNYAAIALTELGRLDEAEVRARGALDGCAAAGDEQGVLTATMWLGHLALLTGRVAEARGRLSQAAGLAAALEDVGSQAWDVGGLAHALAFAGDAAGAAAAIAQLDTFEFIEPVLDGEFCDRGRGWALAVAGRRRDAITAFRSGAARCNALGQRTVEAALLHDLARLGGADAVVVRLAELAGQTDSGLAPLRLAHARALAASDGDALLEVAASFAAIGCLLLAAEAASVAATTFGDSESRKATAARLRAAEHLDRCPGAVLPAFLGGDVRPSPARLTARELEIANLAVMGRPSKDIAAVLGVSVRTVNNLLQRTYTKLGITSRADLPSALADHLP